MQESTDFLARRLQEQKNGAYAPFLFLARTLQDKMFFDWLSYSVG